ncbi:hypothetical protein MA5S0422_3122 [Mycobacteroides abscessus 5S-0422]|uniref:Uncharacterized protein n=1 Tax=Mycobacteroides abscessus subsp. bolletii 1513 TaxID=1299321 RepID=X8DT28_9MYCO|nr:hypothetical protein MA5S0422_3122 [Mycobacteroides abscessus 5S-0422]EIU21847.1 hypothetical protein MA5S0708_5211 [Mycobacteroides abscessus 5S-0708]EIU29590.1 hypothetical protein MA5S1212_1874 [Mycobacteroides abscessus 5S-1212]EUA70670.1 hypothetical protein I540_3362 [Mycobacteroides abscessus subsp. bolletii 1513]
MPVNTTTTVEALDTLGVVSAHRAVLIGAALKDQRRQVVFHFGEDIATVHIAGYGHGPSSYARDDSASLCVSGEPSSGGLDDIEVHATQEQADYARRVLTLLLPYLPDESHGSGTWIGECAQTFVAALAARAERRVWCIRTSNGRILHANASEYSDSDFDHVVDGLELDDIGIEEDDDRDEHVRVDRILEADLPDDITIDGARWL